MPCTDRRPARGPSLYEPFGLVALEAMAGGCLRFRAHDSRELGDLMTLVLSNPAIRFRLVTEASAHVRRFDWADVARRRAAVYAGKTGAGGPQIRSTSFPRT